MRCIIHLEAHCNLRRSAPVLYGTLPVQICPAYSYLGMPYNIKRLRPRVCILILFRKIYLELDKFSLPFSLLAIILL